MFNVECWELLIHHDVPSVAGERPLQHHLSCRLHHQRQIDTEGDHRIFFKNLSDTLTVTFSNKELGHGKSRNDSHRQCPLLEFLYLWKSKILKSNYNWIIQNTSIQYCSSIFLIWICSSTEIKGTVDLNGGLQAHPIYCIKLEAREVFFLNFNDTILREEHKTIYCGLRISKMTLTNQSDLPVFQSPESQYKNSYQCRLTTSQKLTFRGLKNARMSLWLDKTIPEILKPL